MNIEISDEDYDDVIEIVQGKIIDVSPQEHHLPISNKNVFGATKQGIKIP